jgi:hypothetical protein
MELAEAPTLGWVQAADWLAGGRLGLGEDGEPAVPLVFVDLGAPNSQAALDRLPGLVRAVTTSNRVVIGVAEQGVPAGLLPLAGALACTLVGGGAERLPVTQVAVTDVGLACRAIDATVSNAPRAAVTLAGLLRLTSAAAVRSGLMAESLAYSMLLAGPEFARWKASHPRPDRAPLPGPAVLVRRIRHELHLTLNHPARHNAFSQQVSDGLADALDSALGDASITGIRLSGVGPSFSSGGDLDEVGTVADVSGSHLVRLDRSVAARADACRSRLRAVVHGACIGAGVEIPAFAGRVEARDDTFFQLPELTMGLIPGTGGTVGITRRIGRWRTAYLALSGIRLHVSTALTWGLVDSILE